MAGKPEQDLLSKVPNDGSRVGDTALMRALQWNEDDYWPVRDRLVDRGILEIGRGKGGSVRLVPVSLSEQRRESEHPVAPAQAEAMTTLELSETELYPPLAQVLEGPRVRDKRFESAIVHVTALQGRSATGGKWTRHDITVATLTTFPYVQGRHFDVVTFESSLCFGPYS